MGDFKLFATVNSKCGAVGHASPAIFSSTENWELCYNPASPLDRFGDLWTILAKGTCVLTV